MRKLLRGFALVAVAGLGGVLLLEAGLQVAAAVLRATGRERPTAWSTGHRRIVCIGDANTYGLWLERSDSYPAQLESRWNERVGSPPIEVLNLGLPGTNSSRLRRDLPRILETFEPDAVLLLVGANDFWSSPFEFDEDSEPPTRSFLAKHSRVYKRLLMSRRSHDRRELDVDHDPAGPARGRNRITFGDEEFDAPYEPADPGERGDRESLARNLAALVDQAAAFGTEIHLLTYPSRWGFYGVANRAIREVAKATGTPLVDLEEAFAPLCPEPYCPKYLFVGNHHPNARGYGVMAETIVARLRAGEG